jgi:hypothetical protein
MMLKLTNCPYCGESHGVLCPQVKAIEYFPSGKVKRVEFKTAADYMQPLMPAPIDWQSPWPSYPPQIVSGGTVWDGRTVSGGC